MLLRLGAIERLPGFDPLWNRWHVIAVLGAFPIADLRQLGRQDLDLSGSRLERFAIFDLLAKRYMRLVQLELVDSALFELIPAHIDVLVILHLVPPVPKIGLVDVVVVVEVIAIGSRIERLAEHVAADSIG